MRERWNALPDYRPASLRQYFRRVGWPVGWEGDGAEAPARGIAAGQAPG